MIDLKGKRVLVVGGAATSYEIDLASGTAATAGPVTRLDENEVIRDTAIAPPDTAPSQDPGDVYALTEGNKLLSFNSAAPAKVCTSASFSGQQTDERIVGIDVRPADQQLDHAFGDRCAMEAADQCLGRGGRLFARLEYHRVAGDQRGEDVPGGQVRGEVERSEHRENAVRLVADRHLASKRRLKLFLRSPVGIGGDRNLDLVDDRADLRLGFPQRLAGLARNHAREIVGLLADDIREAAKRFDAIGEGVGSPLGPRSARDRDLGGGVAYLARPQLRTGRRLCRHQFVSH